MKKLFDESVIKKLYEKWDVVMAQPNDGTKYGNIDMNAMVQNDILGYCKVREIKELEDAGAMVFNYGKWKIKAEPLIVTSENKERFHKERHIGQILSVPAKPWYDYMENKKNKTQKYIDEYEYSFKKLN